MTDTLYKKSFMLLNSIMLAVVAGLLLEASIMWSDIPRIVREYSPLTAGALQVALRVFFLSGMYGSLIEMASGEHDIITVRGFLHNAREYWRIGLLITFMPFAAHLLLFAVTPQALDFLAVRVLSDLLGQYLFIRRAVARKYLRPQGLSWKAPAVRPGDLAWIAGGLTLSLLAAGATFLPIEHTRMIGQFIYVGAFFTLNYMHFFLFVYLSLMALRAYPAVTQKFTASKEVILVVPPAGRLVFSLASLLVRVCPPVFTVLRALTPAGYRVKEYAAVLWRDWYYKGGCLVGITFFTSNSAEAYRIAKGFRQRGSKVVMGGPHAMFLPEEALEFCDSVVIGDAEPVWEEIVRDYENGCLKQYYYGSTDAAYHEVSHERLMQLEPQVMARYVETGRGCKFRCDFCVIPAICGQGIRHKPVSEVIAYLQRIKRKDKPVTFIDNNIYSDPAYARELFTAMKPLKLRWSASCSVDIARDPQALKLAREAGCTDMLIGYEITSASDEKAKSGKFSLADEYQELTRRIKKAGIRIKAHFIFGFDGDSPRDLLRTWRFCLSLFPFFTILALLTPFPGSKFFRDVLAQKRLMNMNWICYDAAAIVFKPHKFHAGLISLTYPLIYITFLATSFGGLIIMSLIILL